VQILVGIDLAVTKLRIREKSLFRVDFFRLNIYHSICSFFRATGPRLWAILTLNSSNDVFLQQLMPFGGCVNITVHQGGQTPHNCNLVIVKRRFQVKRTKY